MYKNGTLLNEGGSGTGHGSPPQAVAWLANRLGAVDTPLKADEIILSGSLVLLEPIVPGDQMRMEIAELGTLSLNYTDTIPA